MIDFDNLFTDNNTQLALESLCSAVVKLVDADAAHVSLSHPDRHEVIARHGFDAETLPRILNPVDFSTPMVGSATNLGADRRFRASPLCNGEVDHFAALIWAPIKLGGRCFGMLEVCFYDEDPAFWEAERSALLRVAKGARDLICGNATLSGKAASVPPPGQRHLI